MPGPESNRQKTYYRVSNFRLTERRKPILITLNKNRPQDSILAAPSGEGLQERKRRASDPALPLGYPTKFLIHTQDASNRLYGNHSLRPRHR